MNVHLKGGFVVEKGAEFYAGIDAELMSEPDRGCGNYCINAANVFTPNGDGINDYWGFMQSFVTEYSILVYNNWQKLIYSNTNQPVYSNGMILAWDGTGANSNATYTVLLSYKDCNGVTHQEIHYVAIFGLKSSGISNDNLTTEVEDVTVNESNIKIYPNPFSNNVTINFSGNTFPLEFKVMDLSGKVIMQNKTFSTQEIISLKDLAAGTYVINAKAGEFNLVEKLIKR